MDILRSLRRLESGLTRTIDDATQKFTQSESREPLEIMHAIVDGVEKRVEPAGRGKYVFPFDQIRIFILADCSETRARFEAVLGSPPTLQDRIIERVRASGCEWTGLSVGASYVDSAESHWASPWFHIQFDRVSGLPLTLPPETGQHALKLTVTKGMADKADYVFTTLGINLGRRPEVRDNLDRLIRTNHVAFADNAEEPNLSVSRNHAHIECSGGSGEFRLFDDRSAHGTSIVRAGKTIAVPPGPRGLRLQSGDDIFLGSACLHVEIDRVV